MAKKIWAYHPKAKSNPKVPDSIKAKVKVKADSLINKVLKSTHIKIPPENYRYNYLVDIFSKWYRHYFYFCSKYNTSGPNALSSSFEEKFARLEYIGPDEFNLAFKRHTGQWVVVGFGLSLEECLDEIEKEPYFIP